MMNPVPWLQMTNMISYQGLVRTFPRHTITMFLIDTLILNLLSPLMYSQGSERGFLVAERLVKGLALGKV
ncbi:hypothetical protein ACK39T_20305, partial [Aeromonas veronii]